MVAVLFPTSSTPGARPGDGLGRLINARAYKEGAGIVYESAPGLSVFGAAAAGPRGFFVVGSLLYVAVSNALYKVVANGSATFVGALAGSGLVTMARNNKSPSPDIAIVTENGAYVTNGTTITDYPDTDVSSPTSVGFLDGYFLFGYGDGTARASDLNSTNINDQSFTKAESHPDGVLRIIAKGGQVIALGQTSAEFYSNVGASPFPLRRAQVVDTGLFGRWAVAGFEEGWDRPWFSVAADRTVRRWDGYTPTIVSTRAVERSLASVMNPETLTACVYTFGGDAVLSLSGPGFTWEYYVGIGEWFERRSFGLNRWRAQTSVNAFGRWLVGDLKSANVMAIADGVRREGDDPLVVTIEGQIPDAPGKTSALGRLRSQFATGQGDAAGIDPIETDPVVQTSWSFDGVGGRFGSPVTRSLGRQGEYRWTQPITRLGRTRGKGICIRHEISDPVPVSFRGSDIGMVS